MLVLSEPKESPEERSDTVLESTAEEDPLGPKCFYNKAKCFFDNVSSELKSRYEALVCLAGAFPRSNLSLCLQAYHVGRGEEAERGDLRGPWAVSEGPWVSG